METLIQNLPAIISAIAVIITGYFTYNQYTKNKKTDVKIRHYEKRLDEKYEKRRDASGIVWDELYTVRNEMDADRVYIIQPHPLGDEEMLSIAYEVKRKGVQGMKNYIHNVPIADVPKFFRTLCENKLMIITDIDKEIKDDYMRSILSMYGCCAAVIRKLYDKKYDITGSVVCEFTHPLSEVDHDKAAEVMDTIAKNIQYILPEYEDQNLELN